MANPMLENTQQGTVEDAEHSDVFPGSSRLFVSADNAMAWLVTASLRWESEPAAQAV